MQKIKSTGITQVFQVPTCNSISAVMMFTEHLLSAKYPGAPHIANDFNSHGNLWDP